jgi:hypothetical protein
VLSSYEALDFTGARGGVELDSQLNQRIVEVAPRQLAKDAARGDELDAFRIGSSRIRLIAVLIEPVMPGAARHSCHAGAGRARAAPGRPGLGPARGRLAAWTSRPSSRAWSPAPDRRPHREEKTVSKRRLRPPLLPDARARRGGPDDIADFAKVDLRVAQIKSAERVAGSRS